jgi:hypothetical protein
MYTFRCFTYATGLPKSDLVYNTSGISAKYTRHGSTPTTITLVTATQGTYTSSGLIAVNSAAGSYEIHVPNAAFLPGADSVTIDIWDTTGTPVFYCDSIVVDLRYANGVLHQGTAQAGAAGTITLASTAVASDDYYKGALAVIVAGTGVGQSRYIASYVGSTKVATITPNWVTTPDSTSVVQVFAGTSAGGELSTAAQTAVANATVEAEITALMTYNRSANTTATITGPTSGSNSLGVTVDATYDPVKTF